MVYVGEILFKKIDYICTLKSEIKIKFTYQNETYQNN